jgi:hypothetical protein
MVWNLLPIQLSEDGFQLSYCSQCLLAIQLARREVFKPFKDNVQRY